MRKGFGGEDCFGVKTSHPFCVLLCVFVVFSFCVPFLSLQSPSSSLLLFLVPKQLLHRLVFGQSSFHTKQSLHKTACCTQELFLHQAIFFTQLLCQTTCTPTSFYTKQVSHPRAFKQSNCYTKQSLHQANIQQAAFKNTFARPRDSTPAVELPHTPQKRALISLGTGSSMAKPSSIATLRAC